MAKYDWKIDPPKDESGRLTDKGLIVAMVRHVGTAAKLARETELSHTLMNDIYKGATPITKKTEDRIIATYPEINPKWVKDRIGPMFLELDRQPAPQQPTHTAQPAQNIHSSTAQHPSQELIEAQVEARVWHQAFTETMERINTALLTCESRLSSHQDAQRGDKKRPGTGTDGPDPFG